MQNDGNGWYSYTFVGADCANFIFSNNGASQTADLFSCEEYWLEDSANMTTSTNTNLQHNGWSVSPNPASDQLSISIKLQEESEVNIRVYDVSGREVSPLLGGSYYSGNHQFDLPIDLKNGYYFLRMQVGDQIESKPLMIVRQ